MARYFFSGIGGSGMWPLAQILKGQGRLVAGSDRARDQGRTPEKFAAMEAMGIPLSLQDGTGPQVGDTLVISSAVEDTVPDVVAARTLGLPIIKRAALLADLFNGYKHRVAVAGTSGKTTTTGMIGFLAQNMGLQPVVMNGGVMKDFGASALVGAGDLFITEADESDGSIALYSPTIAVLNNIALDHTDMETLERLFGGFLAKADAVVVNADHAGVMALAAAHARRQVFSYSLHNKGAGLVGSDLPEYKLQLVGDHNKSNGLATLCCAQALGLDVGQAMQALSGFSGIARRMDRVGEAGGVVVYDDFAHNPDKIAASLKAFHLTGGRLHIIFQMHGYRALRLWWRDLADTFVRGMGPEDRLYLCDPLYMGGTVDRSIGTREVADAINAAGGHATWIPDRADIVTALLPTLQAGDRVVVMGARDDTLPHYAASILLAITQRSGNAI